MEEEHFQHRKKTKLVFASDDEDAIVVPKTKSEKKQQLNSSDSEEVITKKVKTDSLNMDDEIQDIKIKKKNNEQKDKPSKPLKKDTENVQYVKKNDTQKEDKLKKNDEKSKKNDEKSKKNDDQSTQNHEKSKKNNETSTKNDEKSKKNEEKFKNNELKSKKNEKEPKESRKTESKTNGKDHEQSNSNDDRNKPINNLIYDILVRWWYCMPDWPPKNCDYTQALKENKLRVVDFKRWKLEPEISSEGLKKVYQLEGYEGLFKDQEGNLYDKRPKESCPSFENLKKKSPNELISMYVTALKNQIEQLQNQDDHEDPEYLKQLKNKFERASKQKNALESRS